MDMVFSCQSVGLGTIWMCRLSNQRQTWVHNNGISFETLWFIQDVENVTAILHLFIISHIRHYTLKSESAVLSSWSFAQQWINYCTHIILYMLNIGTYKTDNKMTLQLNWDIGAIVYSIVSVFNVIKCKFGMFKVCVLLQIIFYL